MREKGKKSVTLHGNTPKESRDEILSKFYTTGDADSVQFLIATYDIVKEGLNIGGANHVIEMDVPISDAEDQQTQDRYAFCNFLCLENKL